MRNMYEWVAQTIASKEKKALPVLSFPAIQKLGISVQDIVKDSDKQAEGIRLINAAAPSDAVLKIKALEAFAAAANGRATKIIIPSEIQGLAGLAEGIVETAAKQSAPPEKTEKPLKKEGK